MGTCCILPIWMVLWALNTLSSQQPSQLMLRRRCVQSGATCRLILEPGLVWDSYPCLSRPSSSDPQGRTQTEGSMALAMRHRHCASYQDEFAIT